MKPFKHIILSFMLGMACLSFTSCVYIGGKGTTTMGGGKLHYTQADLQPKSFDKLEMNIVADVYYKQVAGDSCSVRLDFSAIDDKQLAQTLQEKTKVLYRDGGVEVSLDGKMTVKQDLKEGKRVKVFVCSPDIKKITLEGVGLINADTIKTTELKIDNEGVGAIIVKHIQTSTLNVVNEGVGQVKISSVKADQTDLDNEGVGQIIVSAVEGNALTVCNEGVGQAIVANLKVQSLTAENEGIGKVVVAGETRTFKKNNEGFGKINGQNLKVLNK